jgi:hypothetical protein
MAERGIKDLRAPVKDLHAWAGGVADGHEVVVFGKGKVRRLEERLVAETGLTLFIPQAGEGLPEKDPSPEGRLITGNRFLRGLERLGIEPGAVVKMRESFIKGKERQGISSEVWAPVLFQEYVMGCVHLWTVRDGSPPLDKKAAETVVQFTRMIAYALKEGGHFESRRMKDEAFEGKLINISVSGLLFECPPEYPGAAPGPGAELGVALETPGRNIQAGARVMRRVLSRSYSAIDLGCRFLNMAAEDERFLFEYLYRKPFSARGEGFLAGGV